MLKAGILALQGDVREHARAIAGAGATPIEVRYPDDLDGVDVLVMPGGESTTIGKLLARFDLLEPLQARVRGGMPLYGTCAGLILMANDVVGKDDAPYRLAVMDVAVERNAYGRQVDSFETDLSVEGLEEPFRAVFIRAPVICGAGPGVEVLARHDGSPVLVRQGPLWGSTFHPEMTRDNRVHAMFVDHARQVI